MISTGTAGTAEAVDKAALLALFKQTAEARANEGGISPTDNNWNLVSVAEEAGLNLFQFSRDADFLNQIWVVFLSAMKDIVQLHEQKYPTLAAFLEEYPQFASQKQLEQQHLWASANWMALLFTMIPAAKNKGLVLSVIPQLVEGECRTAETVCSKLVVVGADDSERWKTRGSAEGRRLGSLAMFASSRCLAHYLSGISPICSHSPTLPTLSPSPPHTQAPPSSTSRARARRTRRSGGSSSTSARAAASRQRPGSES